MSNDSKKFKEVNDILKSDATFDQKINKLWIIVEKYIPDSGDLDLNKAEIAIYAIQALNIMQGHYAAKNAIFSEGYAIDQDEEDVWSL